MGGRKQRRENVCRVLQAHWLSCPLLLRQHPPHRRAPQAQVPRNRRLTQALLRQRPNLRGIIGLGPWSAMGLPAFARVRNARFDALTDQVALELRKYRQEASESTPRWRREIERLRERDKPNTQR